MRTRLTSAGGPLFAGAVALFDEYRQHYGANPAPDTVATWLTEAVGSERARIYVAGDGGATYGICSVAVVPAALTLRTAWLVRDLYVAPPMRGQGVARDLLELAAHEAHAAGAHRLSLQTDVANVRAIALYERTGFARLTDVAVMERPL